MEKSFYLVTYIHSDGATKYSGMEAIVIASSMEDAKNIFKDKWNRIFRTSKDYCEIEDIVEIKDSVSIITQQYSKLKWC